MSHDMPNLHPPVAATYLVGRERAALFALSGRGAHTALDKVNVAGQRDREVQSFMAPPQSHDTTCVTQCPVFTFLPAAATYLVGRERAVLFALSDRGAHTTPQSERCRPAR